MVGNLNYHNFDKLWVKQNGFCHVCHLKMDRGLSDDKPVMVSIGSTQRLSSLRIVHKHCKAQLRSAANEKSSSSTRIAVIADAITKNRKL